MKILSCPEILDQKKHEININYDQNILDDWNYCRTIH